MNILQMDAMLKILLSEKFGFEIFRCFFGKVDAV